MAPNYPGQHSHFFLIIWANSSVPDCAGLRETTEKGLLISGSQVRALLGSPLFSMTCGRLKSLPLFFCDKLVTSLLAIL